MRLVVELREFGNIIHTCEVVRILPTGWYEIIWDDGWHGEIDPMDERILREEGLED